MKRSSLLLLLTALIVGGSAGCGHLDIGPGGDPNRVLNGTVQAPMALPAGAEIVVRVLDLSGREMMRANTDIPVVDRAKPMPVERVLGEHVQTLTTGTIDPVPFRIEYSADDALLRHGLNVEARVSFGGKVRYRTINAHMLTLASSPYRQDVMVTAVER